MLGEKHVYLPGMEEAVLAAAQAAKSAAMDRGYPEREQVADPGCDYPLKIQHSYGKSPFFMGKSTISMAIFYSYVKLPEGTMWCVLGVSFLASQALENVVESWKRWVKQS